MLRLRLLGGSPRLRLAPSPGRRALPILERHAARLLGLDVDELMNVDVELARQFEQGAERGISAPSLELGEESEGEDLGGDLLLRLIRSPPCLTQLYADCFEEGVELHATTSRRPTLVIQSSIRVCL